MELPSRSSTPSQVRTYIAHLLTTKHELAEEWAVSIANKWSTVRGLYLRTGDSNYFCAVFGDWGRIIHDSVQLDKEAEARWRDPLSGNLNLGN